MAIEVRLNRRFIIFRETLPTFNVFLHVRGMALERTLRAANATVSTTSDIYAFIYVYNLSVVESNLFAGRYTFYRDVSFTRLFGNEPGVIFGRNEFRRFTVSLPQAFITSGKFVKFIRIVLCIGKQSRLDFFRHGIGIIFVSPPGRSFPYIVSLHVVLTHVSTGKVREIIINHLRNGILRFFNLCGGYLNVVRRCLNIACGFFYCILRGNFSLLSQFSVILVSNFTEFFDRLSAILNRTFIHCTCSYSVILHVLHEVFIMKHFRCTFLRMNYLLDVFLVCRNLCELLSLAVSCRVSDSPVTFRHKAVTQIVIFFLCF